MGKHSGHSLYMDGEAMICATCGGKELDYVLREDENGCDEDDG